MRDRPPRRAMASGGAGAPTTRPRRRAPAEESSPIRNVAPLKDPAETAVPVIVRTTRFPRTLRSRLIASEKPGFRNGTSARLSLSA